MVSVERLRFEGRYMDRSAAARYSFLALLVPMLGILVAMLRSVRSYADPPVALEFGPPAFLVASGLHFWYFRREWERVRRGWVESRPWLRYVIASEPQSFRDSVVAALAFFVVGIVLLTLWVTFFAMP